MVKQLQAGIQSKPLVPGFIWIRVRGSPGWGGGFSGGSEGVDTGTMLNCLSRVFFSPTFFPIPIPISLRQKAVSAVALSQF